LENTVDIAEAQRRIDDVDWFHEFDFGNGLRAQPSGPDAEFHRRLWTFMEKRLDEIDFSGKSVLDLGCWDGYWSFYAERRGAKRVLATDDITQNWGAGTGVTLAKELLGSSVELRLDVNVYELDRIGETFDIILFTGIYYHLIDPFYAFAQLRHLCHPESLVVVEGDTSTALRRHRVYQNLGDRLESIFIPRPDDLADMLRTAFFEVEAQHSLRSPLLEWREYARFARRIVSRSHRVQPGLINRTLMICRPVEGGHNPFHFYRPPFDLHRYDPRFSAADT
jgi:tRNA (mo5U34)-methyltransferase